MKYKINNKFLLKIFSFMLCFSIVLGCFAISAEEVLPKDTSEDKAYDEALSVLCELGIFDDAVEYEKNAEVSREDMAYYAARLIGVNRNESENRYFVDVPATTYGAGAIEYLTQLGIFSQSDDKCFHPSDTTLPDELIKVITSLLGYDKYAKANGGYPSGYRSAVQKADLYRMSSEKVTYRELVLLLFSSLDAKMYEPISFGNGGKVEMVSGSENILSIYHKTYISDGAVEAIGEMNVNGTGVAEDEISVSGTIYKFDVSIYKPDYLGKYVKYYYKEEQNKKTIRMIIPYDEETVIDIEDVSEFDQSKIVYNKGNKSTTKTLLGCTYVYNGSKLTSNVDETLKKINKGSVVISDMNDDGTDDTVVIWNFRNFVVSGKGSDQQIFSNKLLGGGNINLDDFEQVLIYNGQRAECDWSDILAGQVLSVAESNDKKVLYLIITDTTFNGTLESVMSSQTPITIVVNGEEYEIEKTYTDEFNSNKLSPGNVYTFKLDAFGKIAYSEAFTTDGSMTFAYVIDSASTDDAFDDYNLKLKLITQDNAIETLNLAERVKIDGNVCKTGAEKAAAFGKSDVAEKAPVGKLIRISKNKDGEINIIDTPKVGASETVQSSLSPIGTEDYSVKWYNQKRFGLSAYVDLTKTFIFCVPDKALSSDEDLDYSVGKIQNYFKEDSRSTANVYSISDRSEFAEAVVYKYSASELRKNNDISYIELMIVDSIGQAMDSEGNIVNCINGMKNGSAVSINIPNNVDISNVGSGDIIKLRYGINDQVVPSEDKGKPDIIVYYDYSKYKGQSPGDDWITLAEPSGGTYLLYESGSTVYQGYRAITQLSFGYAAKKNSTSLWWDGVEKGKSTEMFKVSDIPIMIYDSSKQDGKKLYKGTIDDIDDYESVGGECSRVVLHIGGPYGKSLYVYK